MAMDLEGYLKPSDLAMAPSPANAFTLVTEAKIVIRKETAILSQSCLKRSKQPSRWTND